jgi:hypothetical protein
VTPRARPFDEIDYSWPFYKHKVGGYGHFSGRLT